MLASILIKKATPKQIITFTFSLYFFFFNPIIYLIKVTAQNPTRVTVKPTSHTIPLCKKLCKKNSIHKDDWVDKKKKQIIAIALTTISRKLKNPLTK